MFDINRKVSEIKPKTEPLKTGLLNLAKKKWLQLSIGVGIAMVGVGVTVFNSGILPQGLVASDHDDGETDTKGRNVNLTDLFVFRESDQNPSASASDLILVMNTNPRSLARQQYYFSTNARYEFRIARVPVSPDTDATGVTDVNLTLEFEPPNADNQQQRAKLTAEIDGKTLVANDITTTPVRNSQPIISGATFEGSEIKIFAGLREDPFFFDVEQYFRVRAGALGIGPVTGFRPPATAVDFTKGYNVNTIVLRVPIRFLRGNTTASTFDVWTRIFRKDSSGNLTAVERLARPIVNEGLVITNEFLNTLNAVSPQFESRALQGLQPEAGAAAPIVAEVVRTLKAFGNSDARANTLVNAFLPDVMRIDTLRPSGYGTFLNAKGSPAAGRLLKDDIVDTTLSVIVGSPVDDGVSYEGTPGNPAQGHQPLVPSFPYLAPPN
jgi:hypothetical protein